MIREELEDLRLTMEEGPEQNIIMNIDMRRIWEEINNIYQEITNIISGTGANNPFCRVHLGSNQLNIPDGQYTVVEFDDTTIGTDSVDTHDMWDVGNFKMVIPRDGIYQISYGLQMTAVVLDKPYLVDVFHNVFDVILEDIYYPPAETSELHNMMSTDFYPLRENDELQLKFLPGGPGTDTTDLIAGACFFAVSFVRALKE